MVNNYGCQFGTITINSLTVTREETDSRDDTETDHSYDQEANTDFLFPNLNSESDSDKEDSLFGTE